LAPREVRAVSEQEKTVEENVDVDMAVGFFRALYNYFKANPKTMTSLIHNVSENLIDAIAVNGDLRKDLGFVAGQLRVVSSLIWDHDDKEVVQIALTNSPNLEEVMGAIAELARAYNRLKSSESVIIGEIENLIENAASTGLLST
jgi:hypothetical protein